MKIRNKISYSAFVNERSLLEHFFTTILKSYQKFQKEGLILLDPFLEELNDIMIEKVQYADYGLLRVLIGKKMIKRLEKKSSEEANKRIVLKKMKN